MSPLRIRFLLPVQCHGLTRKIWIVLMFFGLGLLLLTLAVSWDGTYVRLFGVTEEGIGEVKDRATATRLVLANYYAWGWVFVCLAYVLPTLLLPLASSFSLTHTLWLRGLPCSPREVAVARTARLILGLGATAGLSVVWVAVMVIYHGVSVLPMLTAVLGWVAHLLLAGGILLTVGPWLVTGTERATVSFAALLAPPVLFLGYIGLAQRLGDGWMETWFPYAAPFTHNFLDAWKHYTSAAAIGAGLVIWSCVGVRGRLVAPRTAALEGNAS